MHVIESSKHNNIKKHFREHQNEVTHVLRVEPKSKQTPNYYSLRFPHAALPQLAPSFSNCSITTIFFPIFVKKKIILQNVVENFMTRLTLDVRKYTCHITLHTHILLLITYRIISSNRMRASRVISVFANMFKNIIIFIYRKNPSRNEKKSKKFKRNNEILRLRRALSSIIFVKSWSAWSLCAACPRVPLPAHGYPCPPLP